jgi:hypothetical protein
LIAQTCEQAKQFGIRTCTADYDLPDDFLNSSHILVTYPSQPSGSIHYRVLS